MPFPPSTLFLTLLLGGGMDISGSGVSPRPTPEPPSPFFYAAEPPASEVRVGDAAPDFSYQGYDGRWMRLHHLLDQAPVLLVFGANESQLAQIEKEREELLGLGVIPVAVLDRKPSAARSAVSRLGLRHTVLADPRQVIASQFNAVELGRVSPGCFVIDRRGRVRGLVRGQLPVEGYARLCARALAIPMPGTLFPSSR